MAETSRNEADRLKGNNIHKLRSKAVDLGTETTFALIHQNMTAALSTSTHLTCCAS